MTKFIGSKLRQNPRKLFVLATAAAALITGAASCSDNEVPKVEPTSTQIPITANTSSTTSTSTTTVLTQIDAPESAIGPASVLECNKDNKGGVLKVVIPGHNGEPAKTIVSKVADCGEKLPKQNKPTTTVLNAPSVSPTSSVIDIAAGLARDATSTTTTTAPAPATTTTTTIISNLQATEQQTNGQQTNGQPGKLAFVDEAGTAIVECADNKGNLYEIAVSSRVDLSSVCPDL